MKTEIKEWTNIGKLPDMLDKKIRDAMDLAVELLVGSIREHMPVFTGLARSSTHGETFIKGNRYLGTAGNELAYIAPLEEGTDPHWPPIAPLLIWARRKLGDEKIAYAIQKKISVAGTKGAHMFETAEKEKKNEIKQILNNAVRSVERKVN